MFDESIESSPASTITTLDPLDPDWQPILHASNQVVLYNPTSHALSVQRHLPPQRTASVVRRTLTGGRCPYCHRRLSKPRTLGGDGESDGEVIEDISESDAEEIPRARAPNYFQLLQVANESASVPPTPRSSSPSLDSPGPSLSPTNEPSGPFRAGNMAEGYFMAFFREECRLGMGANGSVFLCQVSIVSTPCSDYGLLACLFLPHHQHVLDGNLLGSQLPYVRA